MTKNIAILLISTNKYNARIPNLCNCIFEKFLPEYTRHIFIFSDENFSGENITSINISHLPWPLNTLLRFEYFSHIIQDLNNFDYAYYIDADMDIYSTITSDIIPIKDEIVIPIHWHYQDNIGPYEFDQKNSTAYVNPMLGDLTKKYCQACFFGAAISPFIYMNSSLKHNIQTDLNNNIIARWHDESHINKYILNNPVKRLHAGYCYSPKYKEHKKNDYSIQLVHNEMHTTT